MVSQFEPFSLVCLLTKRPVLSSSYWQDVDYARKKTCSSGSARPRISRTRQSSLPHPIAHTWGIMHSSSRREDIDVKDPCV